MNIIDYEEFVKSSAFFTMKVEMKAYRVIYFLVLMLIIFILWACLFFIDETITTSIILRPEHNISVVRCINSGEIRQLNYRNGQLVNKDSVLLKIDTTSDEIELKNSILKMKQIEKDISIDKALLEAIEDNVLPNCNMNSEEYIKTKDYLTEKSRYLLLIKNMKDKVDRELNKPGSLIINQNVDDLRNEYQREILLYNSWKNTQFVQAIDLYEKDINDKNDLQQHISEVNRNIKNSTIVSPISGRINTIKEINIGDYILAGEDIIQIVPPESENLTADVYISPDYIAKIVVGEKMSIIFPELPPSRYGKLNCIITMIPPYYTKQDNGSLVFIATANISSGTLITKKGKVIVLHSGMTGKGKIIIDHCTIMQMVFQKLDFWN